MSRIYLDIFLTRYNIPSLKLIAVMIVMVLVMVMMMMVILRMRMMLMMTRRPMYGVVQMVSIARKAETRANRLIGRAQLSKRTIHGAFAKLETRFAAKTEVRIESGRWVQIRVGSVLYEHAH